ncbi:hypothetical protein H4R18_003772 [Coemansia javaensis]|uniref:J domain-containing protein n=1 Tax=Coemansia javaensis TaxID=2761396 RepID=A0A9W8LGS3_9FUNG|nr:hypothetical protein H4R18_003772 [Coemansia javaensis]
MGAAFDLGEEAPDLYALLGAARGATDDELRRAYRRSALRAHPDKWAHLDPGSDEARAKTHEFQQLGFAYAVLKDPRKRARYDQTGSVDELLDVAEEGKDWDAYFRELWSGVVDATTIDKLAKTYKGSAEERADVLAAYRQHRGDLDAILAEVLLAEVDDEPRITAVIEEAIAAKEIKRTKEYTRSRKGAEKRRRHADAEAAEADALRKELGLDDQLRKIKTGGKRKHGNDNNDDGDDDEAVKALIRQRTSSRMNAIIANIEEKYAAKPSKSKSKRNKTKGKDKDKDGAAAATAFTEPSEEEFQALQAKLFGKKG